ncbi:MAG: hypothetical protein HN348_25295 [Proteobacteria bacterium]|jgi:hypothetical protein|nr:hypothetical protein [Pseudomonadota bacterium]
MKEEVLDKAAVYEPHTETIRTGSGLHVRIRDLRTALRALNPFDLRRVGNLAGIKNGITDPMDGCDEAVRDILDLLRAMPQYCIPVIKAGRALTRNADRFEDLLRDQRFGVSAVPEDKVAANLRQDRTLGGSIGGNARQKSWQTPQRTREGKWHDSLGNYFWDNREYEGEFSYFIRHDCKVLKLSAGQRFSTTKPYEQCFLVIRTAQGRFYLRWPSNTPQEPAWYFDGDEPRWFFPAEDDFEELFPGFTYEVFGLKFRVPNIGTDYRLWFEDFDDETPTAEASEGAQAPDRIFELLAILEANDLQINSAKALSKQFRVISKRYHPLKHLQATAEEKVKINARYLEIANAYNELKKHFA